VVGQGRAEGEKGRGIAMICTFGDTPEGQWWRELGLPLRSVIRRDGRFDETTPAWLTGPGAAAYAELAGKTSAAARRRVAEMLRESGDLIGEPRPTTHQVRFYERGEHPLEIVTSRQWYIRNGARDPGLRDALLAAGRALDRHPDFMRVRYENWVEGLATDWLISRQRYLGVPFPVWYRVDGSGETQWDELILPDESALPMDPQSDAPPRYHHSHPAPPRGFLPDPHLLHTSPP